MHLATTRHVVALVLLFTVAIQLLGMNHASTVTTSFTAWAEPDTAIANNTRLNNPAHVVVSPSGDIFIADSKNQRIRKLNSLGQLVTIAGRGEATREWDATVEENVPAHIASFNFPEFLAFDSFGILHIADTRNFRVRKILPSGLIQTVATFGSSISGMAFDNNGFLIVVESTGVSRVNTTTGVASALVPGFTWNAPYCVTVDPNTNDVYVGEITNNRILKVPAQGGSPIVIAGGVATNPTTDGLAASRRLQIPYGFSCHGGFLYFVEVSSSSNRVRRINLATNQMVTIVNNGSLRGDTGDGGPATAAALNQPYHVFVHPSTSDLYIAEYTGQRIRKVTAGIITKIAGTGVAGYTAVGFQGTLNRASSVDFDDRNGNMVIGSDANANGEGGSILSLNSALTTVVRNISMPTDSIAIDTDDSVIFTDTTRNQVKRWNRSTGVVSVIAGDVNGQSGNTGNRLNSPTDVHVTPLGNEILIADAFNGRIVRLLGNGSLALVAGTAAVPPVLSFGVLFVSSDSQGALYISDRSANRVYKKTAAGVVTQFTASLPLSVAASPTGGHAFFVSNRQIYMINADGYVSRIAGSGATTINVPAGLTPNECSLGSIGQIKARDVNTVYIPTYVDFFGGSAGRILSLLGPFTPSLSSSISVSLAGSTANFTATATGVPSVGHFVIVQQSSTAPNATQIIAGVSYSGASILANGSRTMQINIATTFSVSISTLPANSLLVFYLIAQDVGLNRSPVRSVQFSTPSVPSPQTFGASPTQLSSVPISAPRAAPIADSAPSPPPQSPALAPQATTTSGPTSSPPAVAPSQPVFAPQATTPTFAPSAKSAPSVAPAAPRTPSNSPLASPTYAPTANPAALLPPTASQLAPVIAPISPPEQQPLSSPARNIPIATTTHGQNESAPSIGQNISSSHRGTVINTIVACGAFIIALSILFAS